MNGDNTMIMDITPDYRRELDEKLNKQFSMSDEEVLNEITSVEMKPSILVMSGGLDTTTLLYYLYDLKLPLEVLSFDYGQEAIREIEIARKHCEKLHIEQKVIKITPTYIDGNLAKGGDKIHDDAPLIPNRNSTFLSIATSYALQNGYERVYYGATKCDVTYCDCQPRYVQMFNLLNTACDLREVQIRAPFINMTKQEVIDLAISLDIDLRETWSCYYNNEHPCGVCVSCYERKADEEEYRNNLNKKLLAINNSLNNYEK